jgi:hypothetical protein
LAPVTLATRADEAGGPPPSKFYERRDNLQDNLVALYNSHITHNGWSVGGNKHYTGSDDMWAGGDQTIAPGTRADNVQDALGH